MRHYGEYSPVDSEFEERIWFSSSTDGVKDLYNYIERIDILSEVDNAAELLQYVKSVVPKNISVNIVDNWR